MANAQAGIFSRAEPAQLHLELDLLPGAQPHALARALVNAEVPHSTVAGVNLVLGFRPAVWERIDPTAAPAAVHGFDAPLRGIDGYTMPATQHDAWAWCTGASQDVLFDTGREIARAVRGVATIGFELAGWSYRHSRDLTGFEDGTGNPHLLEAPGVALFGDGTPCAGGSVVLLQQWRHDLAKFEALDEATQEAVFGRTKVESVEFDDDAMPPNAHVPRTTIEVDGEELPVFRRSVPWGTLSENGLMFVAFTNEQSRLDRMLARMAGAEDGVRDALTFYSTPLTGSYYVVPSADALARFVSEDDEAA